MKEWLEHYIREGVDKFLLIDNGSNDNYIDVLKSFIDSNHITLVIDETRHKQRQLYNKYYLEESKKYEWAIVCDLDEFIYSRNGFKTIKEYLNSLGPSISQVKIPWKVFGSSGYIEQPDSVIKSFTKRVNYDTNRTQGVILLNGRNLSLCKSIIRTIVLAKINIHIHKLSNFNYISSNNIISDNTEFTSIDETELNTMYLHLNHYAIQSLTWFMNVKTTRGSAATINNDKIRTSEYFNAFDINDKEDLELSLKTIIE
jgi:hypothetical protein